MTPRSLLLAAVSGLALLTGPLSGAAMAQTTTAAQPSDPWPQANSDIPADPAVRFGQLPNGMRYAILRNATPPGQASLRLRIDAGSLMENEDQLGLAHFMEHMAFNGTTNIPENELLRILERLGLAFGADTNAATSWDQTFYQLELPRTNDETVDTGLRIMREQVSEALMEADDIDAERGVIEGEERTRNTPGLRSAKAQFALLAPSQRVSERFPIGDLDVIRTAPRQRFVDFYHAYYRPSRATMFAVGDFDVDVMEQKIRSAFESWQPKAPDGPEPDLGQVAPRQEETRILVEPGVQSSVQLNWVTNPDRDPDTVAERRSRILRGLGLSVLNRRLGELARADNPPFIAAGAGSSTLFDSIDISTLTANFNPGGLQRALETAEQEQRRLVQFGVTEAELQREITDTRTSLENAVASAATRTTPGLVNGLLTATNDDRVFTTPQTNLDIFNAAVEGLTPAEVDEAVKPVFEGQGPLALVITPEAIEGGEAAVTAMLQASEAVAVTARAAQAAAEWPYTSFGTPARPTERRELTEVGATQVTFANGTTLVVKPTTFRDEQILISVRTGIGELGMPTDTPQAQSLAGFTFAAGGLGKLTADELARVLSGKIYGASFSTDADAYQLAGSTRPQDLALEMQLLTAYLTDPGLRPAPFEQIKAVFPQIIAQQSATPGGAFAIQSSGLLASGDARQTFPTAEQVAGFTNDQLKAQVTSGLSQGPLSVVMVGDVTVDDAIAAVGATLAALPARPAAPAPLPGSDTLRFPAGTPTPVTLTHNGPPEQALGYVAWPTTDQIADRTEARTVGILADVMELRVLDEIRERQALAYSPSVDDSASEVYPGYGSIFVTAQTTPQNLGAYFSAVDAIAASLRDTPITDDELNRARAPTVEALRRSQAGNEYWLGQLEDVAAHPESLQQTLTHISDLEALTPADIQAAARKYLVPDKAWRASVVSANAPAQ
ncbi:M16 family metallopeptidase [Brevundimonas subvibrioides]|uniref:M16 family metallopeptidase n=1 Tax=Brevundimonas subvibrioides TaxID=74313 RepID=UPI0022B5D5C0|nr:M16 family metallopeptidase [Brevundimonas subvibrioides]